MPIADYSEPGERKKPVGKPFKREKHPATIAKKKSDSLTKLLRKAKP